MGKGKPEIDKNRCKGCGLCMGACPKKILKFSQDINATGMNYSVCFDESLCIACGFCAKICPDAAIEIIKFKKEA